MSPLKFLNRLIEFSFYSLFIITPLILTPYNYELFEFNKMLTVYVFTIVITSAWLIKMIVKKQLILKRTPFDLPLLLFFLSQLISTLLSIDPHTSLWGYYSRFHGGLLSTISYLLLYYAFVSNLAATRRLAKKSLQTILLTALPVSLYALLQHLGVDKRIWVQDVQNRVFSTLGQPNWLAAYLLTLFPLILTQLLNRRPLFPPLFTAILIPIYFLAFLFTKSRSGLLGLALTYALFWGLILLKKKLASFPWKKFFLISLSLAVITLLVGTDLTPSLKSLLTPSSPSPPLESASPNPDEPDLNQPSSITLGGSKSSDIRKVVWQGAIDIWKHYPLFGSGVETFAYSYYNFRPVEHNLLSEWDFLYNKAHNEFLNFLSTTGIFGLSTYVLIILWFTFWTVKNLSFLSNTHLALLAGFLGLAVSNFFGFSVVPVALFFFLWPALAFSLTSPFKPRPASAKKYYLVTNQQYFFITFVIILAASWLLSLLNLWRADRLFALGRHQIIKQEKIPQGYARLQQAVDLYPREPYFHSELSEAAAKMAVLYHQQATQPPPELPTQQKLQIASQSAALRDQMMLQAISQSDLVISQNSVHLNYWKSRAKVFLLLATIDQQYQLKALETLQQAISLAPTDPKLTYNLGLLYAQMNQTDQAQQTLIHTLNLKPNYEAARFALGSLYQQLNQPDQARQQYQYILDHLNPNNQTIKDKLQEL